jgi:hypothetical protein
MMDMSLRQLAMSLLPALGIFSILGLADAQQTPSTPYIVPAPSNGYVQPPPEVQPDPRAYAPPVVEPPQPYLAQPDTAAILDRNERLYDINEGVFSQEENRRYFNVGPDFHSLPQFDGGLHVRTEDIDLKIGGFVKADFIYDFDPIDSTDSFVVPSIPVGAPDRTNSRFHARQTRLSLDARWLHECETVRVFVEGDFFGAGDAFRLRHAFGEYRWLLVGQTRSVFADVAAAPSTLDFEGSVSAITARRTQARVSIPIVEDEWIFAFAVEDSTNVIDPPSGVVGSSRTPSPDFAAHLRWQQEQFEVQAAAIYRVLGFQPVGREVLTEDGWGINLSGAILPSDDTRIYSQVVFGEGIGSFKLLPDVAPNGVNSAGVLPMWGWTIGAAHAWNEKWTSNVTYGENSLDTFAYQEPGDLERVTYLATNLIWEPQPRVNVGIEYLHGLRENVNDASASANRVQVAFWYFLP